MGLTQGKTIVADGKATGYRSSFSERTFRDIDLKDASLATVLEDEDLLQAMLFELSRRYAEENLHFLRSVHCLQKEEISCSQQAERLKQENATARAIKSPAAKRRQKALQSNVSVIAQQFILPDAPFEINIDKTRQAVMSALETAAANLGYKIFEPAKTEVANMIVANFWKRFVEMVKSGEYDMLSERGSIGRGSVSSLPAGYATTSISTPTLPVNSNLPPIFDGVLSPKVTTTSQSQVDDSFPSLTKLLRIISAENVMNPPLPTEIKAARKRVVVVGGGFAGCYIARGLSAHSDLLEVTLVDRKNFFEFAGGLVKAFTDPSIYQKISIPYEKVFRDTNVQVMCGEATGVGKEKWKDRVVVNMQSVRFDYLDVATGCFYSKVVNPEAITSNYRRKTFNLAHKELLDANRVLIVGGGVVGCELACEIKAKYPEKAVTICHSNERFLPRLTPQCHDAVVGAFRSLGIVFHVGARVLEVKRIKSRVYVATLENGGKKIEIDTVYYCGGPQPLTALLKGHHSESLNDRNFAKVNEFMQLEGHPNVFAAGDCADLPIPEPKMAVRAIVQSQTVVSNIVAMATGSPLIPHKPNVEKMRQIVTLGNSALEYNGTCNGKGRVETGEDIARRKWGFINMILDDIGEQKLDPALYHWL